jgi:hypothetical protein
MGFVRNVLILVFNKSYILYLQLEIFSCTNLKQARIKYVIWNDVRKNAV